ncbi:MAG TPA: hypothetical protein VFM09_05930 [Marmoricola sp.]|nr:hypothetical protein [Marmoricola sp.]
MTAVPLVVGLASGILALVDKTPNANDVKAGWTAFAVFIGLGLALVVLGISLSRHLRKARTNAEHGVYDDAPRPSTGPDPRS